MKKLFTIILILSATSCSKDSPSVCWECSIADAFSGVIEHKTICNDGEEPGPFKDFMGNNLAFHCERK